MNSGLEGEVKHIRDIPIVFMVGHGRSGTTLLQSMMNMHPGIIAPPESDFITYLYPRFGSKVKWTRQDVYEFVNALFFNPLFSLWLLNKEKLLEKLLSVAPFADYPLMCKTVICQVKESNKEVNILCDKNPIHSLFIKKILKIFPEAKFIHVIRDPRDSVNGHLKRLNKKNTFFLARRWKRYNQLIEKHKKNLPDSFFTIQYKNMAENTENTLILLCSFLHISFNNIMLKNTGHEGLKSIQASEFFYDLAPDKRNKLFKEVQAAHENSLLPVSTINIDKWKIEMAPFDIAITERITGKFAEEKYGYEVENKNTIPVSVWLLLNSVIIYYCWELYTRYRYGNYSFNTRYKNRIIQKAIKKI